MHLARNFTSPKLSTPRIYWAKPLPHPTAPKIFEKLSSSSEMKIGNGCLDIQNEALYLHCSQRGTTKTLKPFFYVSFPFDHYQTW